MTNQQQYLASEILGCPGWRWEFGTLSTPGREHTDAQVFTSNGWRIEIVTMGHGNGFRYDLYPPDSGDQYRRIGQTPPGWFRDEAVQAAMSYFSAYFRAQPTRWKRRYQKKSKKTAT